MADPFSIVTGSLTLLELSAKVIKQCKHLISAAKSAPQELKSILVEVYALEAALNSLSFLAGEDSEFAEQATNRVGVKSAVTNCEATLDDLAKELGSLSIGNSTQIGTSKRQRVKEAIKWTWKEAEVKKLLNDVLQHKTTITLGLLSQTARDVGDIKKSVQQIQEDLSDRQRRDITSWLETTNPSQNHNFAKDLYESHTGEWVLRLTHWKAWLEENESTRFLWIYGIPGAGKTILASFLIGLCEERCESQGKDKTKACIYYYCSYRNNQDETCPLLQWIVGQLCRLTECIPKTIHDTHRLNQHPRTEVLLDALGTLLSSMQRVYLVVDALDESMPRTGLLELLETLATDSRFQKLQILATSRKYLEIESILSRISTPISMSNEEVDKDIRVYAQAEIKRTCSRWSEDLKLEALEALVHGAEGM